MEVQNKVVIITGASMGIGAATARVFAEAGAKVVLAARSVDKLEAVAASLPAGAEALVVPTDMTDRAQVQALVDKAQAHLGRVDVLINNAGQALAGWIATVDPDNFRQIMELNLFGVLHGMQTVIPKMKAQNGGVIVNISSSTSKMAMPKVGAYAATKYALNGLTLTARNELAEDNIRVVLFIPKLTNTNFVENTIFEENVDYWHSSDSPPQADSAESVARKILQATIEEPAEMTM